MQSRAPSTQRALGRRARQAWIRALEYTKFIETAGNTLALLLDDLAATHGDRPALLGEGERLSYRDLAAQVNRYARWAMANGLAPGDVVGLMMPNRSEYVAIWLGLTRAGCVVALINTNLVADALLHSIGIARPALLIVAEPLLPVVRAIAARLPGTGRVWVHGGPGDGSWPLVEPARYRPERLDAAERALPASHDSALLIFTSGTTGLLKAARVTHRRVAEWSFWFAGMMDAQAEDRLYDCLPMYHSVGGIVAIGALLVRGGSVLIRAKFSASRFWNDVVEGECTIFQYIGELCRYLTRSPPHPLERGHRLRLACGNGLQLDVWEAFQQRFGIPEILEFYAATEGRVSLYNCEGKPGAIGRIPGFLAHRFSMTLIRSDPQTGNLPRDAVGFCSPCAIDEIGEAIGRVDGSPTDRFDGYTDPRASAQKLVRDVFAKGDCWFRTGDLMRRDAEGFYYFIDRIGDTFRWKGENVSTTEVSTVLRAFPGVSDAVVYGVGVPGHEGRAGMAAVIAGDGFQRAALPPLLAANLPHYAQPLFLRQCREFEITGTFKLTKAKLVQESYANSPDPVWFHDRDCGRFIPCDAALLQSLADGSRRL